MTQVVFYRNSDGLYTGFKSEGHSGYAEEGEDIVCAAISALVFGTINSIETLTDDKPDVDIDEDEAYVSVSFDPLPGEQAQLLLKSLVLSLELVEFSDKADGHFEMMIQEV